MMRNLFCEEGGLLQVESASLPVASYAKFQPQSVDFLDITNPKAVYPLLHVQLMNASFIIQIAVHDKCENTVTLNL